MLVCSNCGKRIEVISRECPYCHTVLGYNNYQKNNNSNSQSVSSKYFILSYLVPFLGLVYYFNQKNINRSLANKFLTCSIINIACILIIAILIAVIL